MSLQDDLSSLERWTSGCISITWLVTLRVIPGTSSVHIKIAKRKKLITMRNGNGVAESEMEQTDEFNGQFKDMFRKNEHSQIHLQNRSVPFMNDIVCFFRLKE